MAVLECDDCGAKVESNRCCGSPMALKEDTLECGSCGKTVSVNRCCGKSMHEMEG
ncbi:MAG: hypothetical protein AB1324_01100 [Candidatus Micrarchaeota archaeon]